MHPFKIFLPIVLAFACVVFFMTRDTGIKSLVRSSDLIAMVEINKVCQINYDPNCKKIASGYNFRSDAVTLLTIAGKPCKFLSFYSRGFGWGSPSAGFSSGRAIVFLTKDKDGNYIPTWRKKPVYEIANDSILWYLHGDESKLARMTVTEAVSDIKKQREKNSFNFTFLANSSP